MNALTAKAHKIAAEAGVPHNAPMIEAQLRAKPITDALLDQLEGELRQMADELRCEGRAFPGEAGEDDGVRASKELSEILDDVAACRPLLVRFAFTLRRNHDRHSALRVISGGAA